MSDPIDDKTHTVRPASDPEEIARRHQSASTHVEPERIGRYHIKRVIASGGMGTVYEATQDNPRRVVAVKVMKQGITSKSALRRFEYEGQILGRLRHPGIAQIYEAGTHDEGHGAVPYFAMEYIPNAKPITKFADEKKLGTRQRMELFAKVCDAIHHGHQKGIIHRDLKPSNILVDSTGQVKIIDFGVARCTDSDLAVTTLQTDVGQLIGTLQYMSPEQCEGDPHDIDTRSDVYALGVVFYQLLCGKLPYDVTRMAMHQATRAIREQTPTKLTTINKTLRGDVATIALKALEKERERRYQSAADFGHDIQRYLTGEAITARRASIVYQLRLFARRNKAVFASLAAVFIVLIVGIIVSTSLYVRAEHARADQSRERERAEAERDRAEREAQTTKRVSDFLVDLFKVSDPSEAKGNTITAREILDKGAEKITGELADQPLVRATLLDAIGTVYMSIGLYVSAQSLLESALTVRRRELGAEHPAVAESLGHLGTLLRLTGKLPEAEAVQREALALYRQLPNVDMDDMVASLMELAASLQFQGELVEAESLLREALAVRTGDPQVLYALGMLLAEKGMLSEAEDVLRKALVMSRELRGDEHPDVASSLNTLGLVLAKQGKLVEAEPLYRESLDINRRLFGDQHGKVANGLGNLGLLLKDQGRLTEGEALLRESVEGFSAALGTPHWRCGAMRSHLGDCLTKLARFEEAEGQLVEAHTVLAAALGLQHERTVLASKRLVGLYDAWDTAEPGKGYAEKAAQWRARLETGDKKLETRNDTPESQNVETPKP